MSNQTRCCSAVELARDVVERSVSWGVTPAGGAKFKVERSSPQSQRGEWRSPRCQRGETFSMYQRDYTEGIPQVVVSKRRSNSACWTSQLRRKLPLQSRTSLWQEGKALSECWGKAGYEPKKRPSCTHTTSCCLSGQHRPLVCLQREQREVKIPWMQGHDQGQVHEMWSFFSVSPVRRTTFLISTHSKAEMVLVLVKWDILVVLMLVSQETKRGFAECALW